MAVLNTESRFHMQIGRAYLIIAAIGFDRDIEFLIVELRLVDHRAEFTETILPVAGAPVDENSLRSRSVRSCGSFFARTSVRGGAGVANVSCYSEGNRFGIVVALGPG